MLLSYVVLFTVSITLGVDTEQCNIEYKVQQTRRKRLSFVPEVCDRHAEATLNVRVNRDFVATSQNKQSRWKL